MSDDTILKEVDEELRSDRMRSLWRRFGPYLIIGAVLVVLAVAVNEGWSWWQRTQAAQSSDQFYAALKLADGTDVEAAQKALNDVIDKGSGGYPMLARFRQASLLAQDGKIAEAVKAYDALATSQTNQHLREVALLLGAYLLVDAGDVTAVQQRVTGLITANDPLRNAARETLGLVKYKAGDLDGAAQAFQDAIADPSGDTNMRGRLQLYLSELIAQGAKDPNAPADTAASTSGATAPAPDASAAATTAAPATDTAPATAVDSAPAMDVTPPASGTAPAAGATAPAAPADGGTMSAAPADGGTMTAAPADGGTMSAAPADGGTMTAAPADGGTMSAAPADAGGTMTAAPATTTPANGAPAQ